MTVKQIEKATAPEDLFGLVTTEEELRDGYRELAETAHPDKGGTGKSMANLNRLRELGLAKLKDGTYGKKDVLPKAILITTKADKYELVERLPWGDICDVYKGTNSKGEPVFIKLARSPGNKDLMVAEQTALKAINESDKVKKMGVGIHIPKLLDSFELIQAGVKRQVNVTDQAKGYTLSEIIDEYPDGLDLRDAAWMFRRLLGAILAAHAVGICHRCITPDHVVVEVESHNATLVDWCYAGKRDTQAKAIVPKWKHLFPAEIGNKVKFGLGADLYMAAECLSYLLEGGFKLAGRTPSPALPIIQACLMGPVHRMSDVRVVYDQFEKMLEKNFGKPKFREFAMPRKAA